MIWKVVIASEVLTVPRYGVGSRMQLAQVQLQTDVVLSWTLIAIALTALGDLFFEGVVSLVVRTRSTVQRRRVDALLKRF
jgi:NitT/TauT family transport system permease protein